MGTCPLPDTAVVSVTVAVESVVSVVVEPPLQAYTTAAIARIAMVFFICVLVLVLKVSIIKYTRSPSERNRYLWGALLFSAFDDQFTEDFYLTDELLKIGLRDLYFFARFYQLI